MQINVKNRYMFGKCKVQYKTKMSKAKKQNAERDIRNRAQDKRSFVSGLTHTDERHRKAVVSIQYT